MDKGTPPRDLPLDRLANPASARCPAAGARNDGHPERKRAAGSSFTGWSGACSGTGACTVTLDQDRTVTATFNQVIQPPTSKCKVPNVIGKRLGVAKTAINRRHCRVGKVGYAYSRKRTRGFVISQSRGPGRVLPAKTKINLVVSRGRR